MVGERPKERARMPFVQTASSELAFVGLVYRENDVQSGTAALTYSGCTCFAKSRVLGSENAFNKFLMQRL
jgi:Tfp pilus assembly protein PilX